MGARLKNELMCNMWANIPPEANDFEWVLNEQLQPLNIFSEQYNTREIVTKYVGSSNEGIHSVELTEDC